MTPPFPRAGGRGAVVTWALAMATRLACAVMATSCASTRIPDPREAARSYARAAAAGDAHALYGMMTAASRRAQPEADVRRLVDGERAELAEQARAIAAPDARVEASAELRFADGEEAALDLRDGRYWVTAAGSLPGGARTLEQALEQLRRVLARRSYSGLMRVLSPATRASVENDVRALVEGLTAAGALPIELNGDAALVPVPGGHEVRLKRVGGVWHVEDFD